MSPNREAAEVAVLADVVAAFGGRLVELALVDEVHVVAGAHTAADSRGFFLCLFTYQSHKIRADF